MRKIYLHGRLNKSQIGPIELDVDTPTELIIALRSQVKGFDETFRNEQQVAFVKRTGERFTSITEQQFALPFGDADDIHLISSVEGAEAVYGFFQALYAYWQSFAAAYPMLAAAIKYIAISFIMAAVSTWLAPKPTGGAGNAAADVQSFIFNGPINSVTPGAGVPIVYGEFRVGSVVISAGSQAERVAI